MLRNTRLFGILLWLFAFQTFAATSGGYLANHLWLDISAGLLMFMAACLLLGFSLPGSNDLAMPSMLILIFMASLMLTARIGGHLSYKWYDLMIVMAAPQVVVLAISFWVANHRFLAQKAT